MTSDGLYPNTTRYIRNALEMLNRIDGATEKDADLYIRAATVLADLADVAQRIEQDSTRRNT